MGRDCKPNAGFSESLRRSAFCRDKNVGGGTFLPCPWRGAWVEGGKDANKDTCKADVLILWKGWLKSIFWGACYEADKRGGTVPPAFWPAAQAEFISAGHLKSKGWSRPLGGGTHKKRTSAKQMSFSCGKALQSRYFKFSICHLEILPNGPSGPRRFCGVRAFCRRQNLGGGMALPSRAFESPKGGAGPRPAKPKKKDTL